MNEFDHFVKQILKVKYYVRYTDDFVIVSHSKNELSNLLVPIQGFLSESLHLTLHPQKVEIRKVRQGIDFLGYVILPYHKRVRTKTKRRMMRKIKKKVSQHDNEEITDSSVDQMMQSYLGVLSHADTYRLAEKVKNQQWFLRRHNK